MTKAIKGLIKDYENTNKIKAIVIVTPGPLSYPEGVVINSPNLCWDNVALRDEMQKEFSYPLLVEKDTNAAALGEYYFGQDSKYRNLIYITVSTGVGAGIIINGKLYRGISGGAGEIGHMVVEPNGAVCQCGRQGCLEALASGTAIAREGGTKGAKEIGDSARQGDKEALRIINSAGDYLAIGIGNLVNIFNPEAIILGGGVMQGLKDLWLDKLRQQVYSSAFPLNTRKLQIDVTKLGDNIGLYGCVAVIIDQENKR